MKINRLLLLLWLLLTALVVPREATGNDLTPVVATFSRKSATSPRYSTLSGSNWSSSAAMPSVGREPAWVVARNCPTRNEIAFGSLDYDEDVNLLFFNGSTWSSPIEVCSNTGQFAKRAFDLAYEQASGDLLAAYWAEDAGKKKVGYRTYSGASVSSESFLTLPESNQVWFISLTPQPDSNEIMLLAGNSNGKLYAAIWNGASFGSVTTIETNSVKDYESFAAVYESKSSNCLIAYSNASSNQPRSIKWNGSTWSSVTNMPSVGSQPRWIRLAADPTSNKVICGILTGGSEYWANAWSGSAWGSATEIESKAPFNDRRAFDVAFEPCGSTGLYVYCKDAGANSRRARTATWNGSSWQWDGGSGSDLADNLQVVQLVPNSAAGEIIVAISDETNNLNMARWSGGSLGSFSQLETSLGGSNATERYMIAAPTASCLIPANTPYVNDFEGSVGPEWSNTTVTNNATFTKFLGQHRNNSVKLALNTTPGTVYSLTFDLYAIDSWDGTPGPYGPDAFQVSMDGTIIFNHTFIHDSGWINDGYSYPYPPDQSGHYGFSSNWKDGIFRTVEVVFTASSSVTTLAFMGALTDESGGGMADESWGIDNVSVKSARFIDVSSATGFAVSSSSNADTFAAAAHWGDFDGDGDLDVILTGNTAKFLTNNNAGVGFTSATFGGGNNYRQGALLDISNDGHLDFWISCANSGYDTERLYTNNGSGGLSSAGNAGFSAPTNNEGVAAIDVNRDGWIDIVQCSENGNYIGLNQGGTSVSLVGTNGSGYGLHTSGNFGNGDFISAGDVNNDGYVDLFYHYSGGKLFVSKGEGTYARNNYGISVVTGNDKKIGSAWADYDNDGDLDLYVPRFEKGYSGYLWRNNVNWATLSGTFANINGSSGVNLNPGVGSNGATGMRTCAWGDLDNDGDLDLVIAGPEGKLLVHENQGDGTFKRIGAGLRATGDIMDVVFVDYDNDGDLDLSVTRVGASAMLFQNQTNNADYLKVRLIGRGEGATNCAAVGVRVELWSASGKTYLGRRDIGTARGFSGTEPLWAHFGGVNPNTSYKLKIYFDSRSVTDPYVVSVTPSAASTTIGARVIPQMITITEPNPKKRVMSWSELRN
ncbi:MAG: VCBS repeat-containing protein [Phycisphaerae bacterium]|nr:VCBS repeat-containing protein [Phycisphaerae bacterium]